MQEHPPQDSGGYWRSLKKEEDSKGFTLVELIVVIVILAILAAILIPGLLKWIDQAKDKKYELEARDIMQATEAAYAKLKAEGVEVKEGEIEGKISDHPWGDDIWDDDFWYWHTMNVTPEYGSRPYVETALKDFTDAKIGNLLLWGTWEVLDGRDWVERPWDGNVGAAEIIFLASDGTGIMARYHINYGWKIIKIPEEYLENWFEL